jgi:23S rRNA pseudouridine1911/1915/1917 synthase
MPDSPIVVYEDNHLLVCDKPAGMPTQGDETGDLCLVDWAKAYVVEKYNKEGAAFIGLVHRLDRPTSGLVILTKTSKALARMNQAVAERTVEKRYYALVAGTPDPASGTLEDYLLKNNPTNTSRRVSPKHPHGKRAELVYQSLLKMDAKTTLVAINLHTGRHHQIRVQFSARGWPLIGDVKYGGPASQPVGQIRLHAGFLSFQHPVRAEKLSLESKPDWAPLAPSLAQIF